MQLNKIPYISHVPTDGRDVFLQPWFDASNGEWHLYLEKAEGDFIKMQIAEYYAGLYYSTVPASATDLYLPLATLIAQHLSFPRVTQALYSLVDDLNLMCASLEKLRVFWGLRESIEASSFLVESDLEYLFTQTRAMFDVFQSIIKSISRLIRTTDGREVIAILPDSFAKVILSGDEPRSVEEIQTKFSLPRPMAVFYVSQLQPFLAIRDIRVAIEHQGKRIPTVFETKKGFGVSTKGSAPWSTLEVWTNHELQPNGIGSVKALTAFLARSILKSLDDFETALRNTINPGGLPRPVAYDNRIFLRNPLIHHLSRLPCSADAAWEPPEDTSV